jgi:hypothetical protein
MYAIKLLWGGATLNPDTSRGGSALVSESTVVVSRPPILHHLMSGLMAGGSRSFACRLGAPLQYHHIQRHGFSTERFAGAFRLVRRDGPRGCLTKALPYSWAEQERAISRNA